METEQIKKKIKENNKELGGSSWLLNQYPLIKDRLLQENYLNFGNLKQFEYLGEKLVINISEVQRFLKETTQKIVILVALNKNLNPTKPIILAGDQAIYYPQYELFRESLNYKPFGWIEIFHNFDKDGK